MADKLKFSLALLLLIAGVAGFYAFSDEAAILRVLMVLAGVGLSVLLAWQTEFGRKFLTFAKDARDEAKKVVWPGKKETMQTTGMVFVFVLIMATFLWLTDKGLEWVLYDLVLGWRVS